MGTVVAGDGIHVGIPVGIVKAVGDLFVDVHVGGGQTRLHTRGACISDESGHLVKGQAQLIPIGGKIAQRESGVVVVQTRIQNGNHSSGSVIGKIRAVEDTRVVDVDGILHQLGRVTHRLGLLGLVHLTDDGGSPLTDGLGDSLEIPRLDGDLKAAEHVGVILAEAVCQLGSVQIGQQRLFLRGNAGTDSGGLVTQRVFRKGHARGSAGILLQKGSLLDLNDDRDLVRLLDGLGKLVHHRAVEIVIPIGDETPFKGTNTATVYRTAGDQPRDHGRCCRQNHNGGQNCRQEANPSFVFCRNCDHMFYLSSGNLDRIKKSMRKRYFIIFPWIIQE